MVSLQFTGVKEKKLDEVDKVRFHAQSANEGSWNFVLGQKSTLLFPPIFIILRETYPLNAKVFF